MKPPNEGLEVVRWNEVELEAAAVVVVVSSSSAVVLELKLFSLLNRPGLRPAALAPEWYKNYYWIFKKK